MDDPASKNLPVQAFVFPEGTDTDHFTDGFLDNVNEILEVVWPDAYLATLVHVIENERTLRERFVKLLRAECFESLWLPSGIEISAARIDADADFQDRLKVDAVNFAVSRDYFQLVYIEPQMFGEHVMFADLDDQRRISDVWCPG
ncbi:MULTISPECIES: hypothetical protein [Deinococcus]|uniref:Uncharacterized protein n=1 Tax=Deinococcus rufus TaxID=2136097 RepID=A0ABV7Z5P4_9DEIO|nr:hypothetical protein [Deinococcus sp. AB2017081]WQE96470.1 hypothetical protein U2P90_06105 [Deinococcus sp. AB2017081]